MVEKESDFINILELVRMKPEIKELMEGVLGNMNKDLDLVSGYYDFKEENDRINNSIIKEVTRKSIKEGFEKGLEKGLKKGIEQREKELVISMYNNNIPIEKISNCSNLSIESIEEIINNSKENN